MRLARADGRLGPDVRRAAHDCLDAAAPRRCTDHPSGGAATAIVDWSPSNVLRAVRDHRERGGRVVR
jgi:hypothetical protein